MTSKTWVDFRQVKAAVTMRMALEHYGITKLRKSGDELRGRCPIHQGDGQNTFHASLSKNAFQCFSCKARGNVLDFVAAMEHCTVREAAGKLADWFDITGETAAKENAHSDTAKVNGRGEENKENLPLSFQLKGIDPSHPYLAKRGISQQTAQRFGVGSYAGKGSMANRLVIPIHNAKAELVAYAGRSLDGSEPKYKFPAGFHKALELFNLHRVLKEAEHRQPIVVVEGFFDCMKVDQAGLPVVALMGCSLSMEQAQLLREFDQVLLMLDGDEPGRSAAEEISNRLKHELFVRIVDLPDGKQPDQLSSGELQTILS